MGLEPLDFGMGTEGDPVVVGGSSTFDSIVKALGRQPRRQILLALLDHDPLDYRDTTVGSVALDRTEAEIQLAHVHLPLLDDMGYVSWHPETGRVVKGANWDAIEPTLLLLSENRERLPDDVF